MYLACPQNVASAALFLAAKVEEQPQKLEYVARVYHSCINRDHPSIDPSSEVRSGSAEGGSLLKGCVLLFLGVHQAC